MPDGPQDTEPDTGQEVTAPDTDAELGQLLKMVAYLIQVLNDAGLRHACYMAQILYFELQEVAELQSTTARH